MLRKVRIAFASVFFIGITLLFLDFSGSLHAWLGWMSRVQFLPTLLATNVAVLLFLVMLTLVFGRVYCSVICPMGVMQDIIAWLGKRKNHRRYGFSKEKRVLRWAFFAAACMAWIAGVASFVALLAPYSSYGRMVQNLFQPLYLGINNILALGAEHVNSYAFYSKDVWIRSLPTFIIAVVTFITVAFLAWRNGRTYCNTVCPVGTILSVLARFSWLKIRFDGEKCRSCSLCTRGCKAACIDFKRHYVDYSRCVVCGDCLTACKFDALHYTHKAGNASSVKAEKQQASVVKATTDERKTTGNVTRRSFLVGAAIAFTAAAKATGKKKTYGGMAVVVDKEAPNRATPITPPGSLSAQNMARHCTGCQLCVAECPNDVLRPSADLLHLMQPVMSFERGYCRPECNHCSQVCPTGAIKPVSRAEKTAVHVGHAVWVKKNCLPVTDGVECGNCARHCPVNAIQMVPLDEADMSSPFVPAVNEEHCIGCGACENLCPSRPFSAIYVEGHEVQRRDKDSQKAMLSNEE